MSDAPQSSCKIRCRWFRSAPDRVVLALLPLEGLLILSERFGWFAFNAAQGLDRAGGDRRPGRGPAR